MAIINITTLRGQEIPCMWGTGPILIPVLTGDAPVKHWESMNWHTFAEIVEISKKDHKGMDLDTIVLACIADCDTKQKKTRCDLGGRTVHWILFFLFFYVFNVCVNEVSSPVEGVQSRWMGSDQSQFSDRPYYKHTFSSNKQIKTWKPNEKQYHILYFTFWAHRKGQQMF